MRSQSRLRGSAGRCRRLIRSDEARRSTLLSTDVTLKVLDDEILFGDDVSHQTPDRDETDQLAVIQDGKMTQPLFRHQRHTLLGTLLWTHIHNLACHDVAYRRLLRRS